jgi:hypothetical protein
VVRDHQHTEIGLVAGDLGAEAVENTSPHGGHELHVDAVFVGQGLVLLALDDGQLIHAREKDAEQARDPCAQDQRAPCQRRVALQIVAVARQAHVGLTP